MANEIQNTEDLYIEDGSDCPDCKAVGSVVAAKVVGCSCHINPPCSACTDAGYECSSCGWETDPKEEFDWEEGFKARDALSQKLWDNKRGARRKEHTSTYVSSPFNSTPFTRCCDIAAVNTSRCPHCEAEIWGHDDGLSERRRQVGAGNCLMCGKSRAKAMQPGGCCC